MVSKKRFGGEEAVVGGAASFFSWAQGAGLLATEGFEKLVFVNRDGRHGDLCVANAWALATVWFC